MHAKELLRTVHLALAPYPSLKGLEAVRESLAETTPALKNADLKKFIDDRFVKSR
ncbi:MAG TPA: hypothetical protein VGL11_01720 [Candidatus Binatia bacterium]|jgi:hypothetical protein